MGSTAKIIFGCFLAICFIGMFLLFSMQKSAQLSLDMKAMQMISKEKDDRFATISDSLQTAKTTLEHVQAENAIIPELKNSIKSTENEKLVYVQQLDDFQAELQNQVNIAKQRLTEIETLQTQQSIDQEALGALETQSNELAAALDGSLADLEERTLQMEGLTDTLLKKNKVIEIYKEKLDRAADNLNILQKSDSNEQLNLVLILDELAKQTALANDLEKKLTQANNEAIASGVVSNDSPAVNTEDQALVEKLVLENDYLGTGIKERNIFIEELKTKLVAAEELLESYAVEIEQLQLLITDKEAALAALQLQVTGSTQEINQLSATLTARDKEIENVNKQTQGIAAPLTEKITGLELQITQTGSKLTTLSDQLSQSEASLDSLGEAKQLVSEELASTQTALESLQNKALQSEENSSAMQENISVLEQQLIENNETINTITADFEAATSLASDQKAQIAELNEQLAVSETAMASAITEQKEHITRLITEIADANATVTALEESKATLQTQNNELLAALTAKEVPKAAEDISEPEIVIDAENDVKEDIVLEPASETVVEIIDAAKPTADPDTIEVIVIKENSATDEQTSQEITTEAEQEIIVEKEATDVKEDTEQAPANENIPLQEDSTNEVHM